MNFRRLFVRDCVYYRKPFAALSAAACLGCAVLASALFIGDSVRGTLHGQVERNAALVEKRLRFPFPVSAEVPGGVLHVDGVVAPDLKAQVYAFPDNDAIGDRDAYASEAMTAAWSLRDGDVFTLRVLTLPAIDGESLMGRPPELKQASFIYRGVWKDARRNIQFDNPQRQALNLFVNAARLAQILDLDQGAVNEVWMVPGGSATPLSDEAMWSLSRLTLTRWKNRPVLKSRSFFMPEGVDTLFPDAIRGLVSFAESFGDGQNGLHYFFVGAFEGDILPVEPDRAVVASESSGTMSRDASLTYFATDAFRNIIRKTFTFPRVDYASDAGITAALTPDIPGLTDAGDCARWDAGLPVDFGRITRDDEEYWNRFKSKPKVYLNFAQAQALFFPGQYNVLIFDADASPEIIRETVIKAWRERPDTYTVEDTAARWRGDIDHGVPFAALFLGLSAFIEISALLMLGMLIQLHGIDRAPEWRLLNEYGADEKKTRRFLWMELSVVLLPGMLLGGWLGAVLCRVQLYLLEHAWNGIVDLNQLEFHASRMSWAIAFVSSFLASSMVVLWTTRSHGATERYYCPGSRPVRSVWGWGLLSFARRWGQYRVGAGLLVLGFLATLGVGAFGIKARGENAFGYAYVAETALPVVPPHDEPFPPGGLPVRVRYGDGADCANILRASDPMVYGCDMAALTGESDFLPGTSAAVDAGSLQWIIKRRKGDVLSYPRGDVTLDRVMRATVFQRGIVLDRPLFETLFPEVRGASFFLIRDGEGAEIYKKYLAPYGVTVTSTDAFMAEAEGFQHRYLAIFLQLGGLGFLLGVGSLVLLMLRNLHATRDERAFLADIGFSERMLFRWRLAENLILYLGGAVSSLILLMGISCFASMSQSILIVGWSLLTGCGSLLIIIAMRRGERESK